HQRERLGSAGGSSLERGPLVVQKGLDRLAQIFDQMKAINHLHGLRCPTPNALGIEGTAVPTDDGALVVVLSRILFIRDFRYALLLEPRLNERGRTPDDQL